MPIPHKTNASDDSERLIWAYQATYTMLMGFTITYFLRNISAVHEIVAALAVPYCWLYIVLWFYFIINCLRFQFGLIAFTSMITNGLVPKLLDYRIKNLLPNSFKSLAVNTGILQMVILCSTVFFISPSSIDVSNGLTSQDLITVLPQILYAFAISLFFILALDLVAVSISLYFIQLGELEEKFQMWLWFLTGIAELLITVFLISWVTADGSWTETIDISEADIDYAFYYIYALIALLAIEIMGGWNYIAIFMYKAVEPHMNMNNRDSMD